MAAPDYTGFGATIIKHTGQSVSGQVVTRYARAHRFDLGAQSAGGNHDRGRVRP